MNIPMIVFVAVYVICTISYLFSETSGNFKRRAINKIGLASLFFIYALVELFRCGNFNTIQSIAMIGVALSYLGDILLLWSFSKGGFSFGFGNVFLAAYEILYLGQHGYSFRDYWWFLLVFIFMIGMFTLSVVTGWMDLGKYKILFFPYIISVTVHGSIGVTMLTLLHDPKSILLATGLILFMVSDYFIALHKFKYKESKAILRCNSSSYFIGLMLVALSFSF